MAGDSSRFDLSMAATVESVSVARGELMRWLRSVKPGDDELCAAVALAVSEAVSNVVRHAYKGDRSGRVEVDARLKEGEVELEVRDEGTGLSSNPRSTGPGGMGLPVIGRVSDGVVVDSTGSGTRVVMRFHASDGPRRRPILDRRVSSRFAPLGA